MPKRDDISSILLIGSGPIIIGQACEFDYSGTQACRALREEGYRVILVNSNPATIMTDPDVADATYIEPITAEWVERVIEKEKPDALLPTMGGQTALNVALELHDNGVAREARGRAHRRGHPRHPHGRGPRGVRRGHGAHRPQGAARRVRALGGRSAGDRRGHRIPGDHPAFVHAGRHGRRHRLEPRGIRDQGSARARAVPDHRGPDRPQRDRVEGVRARGHAGRRRQRRHRVLDRELRRDGRAHRRLDHGRPGHDAVGPRVPGDAGRGHRDHPRDRRGGGRLQRPVRPQPDGRRAAGHRDEPARIAQLGPRVEGHRFPDRPDRRQAGRRVSPGRDRQRDHAEDPVLLRAGAGLRGGQDPALRVREVPAGRRHAGRADEGRGRGDGHRPHLQPGVAQGVPGAGERPRGLGRGGGPGWTIACPTTSSSPCGLRSGRRLPRGRSSCTGPWRPVYPSRNWPNGATSTPGSWTSCCRSRKRHGSFAALPEIGAAEMLAAKADRVR